MIDNNIYSGTYIKSLDGLRAISIICVLFFHTGNLLCGWIGVQVFFVLSGYLITQNLLKAKTKTFSNYIKNFYWHRSLRIFPLYFGFLILLSFVFILLKVPKSFDELWSYLFTYTYNLTIFFPQIPKTDVMNHFWSLCVEEQFYLMWPFIVYFLSKRKLGIFIIFTLLTAMPFRYFLGELLLNLGRSPGEVGNNIYWFTLAQVDSLMLGALVA